MIVFYSGNYDNNRLRILKSMLLEGLYFLKDSIAECNSGFSNCETCQFRLECKDFQRIITHVEKLVENVEN